MNNLGNEGEFLATLVGLQCLAEGRTTKDLVEDYISEMEETATKIKDFAKTLNCSETTKFLFIKHLIEFIDKLIEANDKLREEFKDK